MTPEDGVRAQGLPARAPDDSSCLTLVAGGDVLLDRGVRSAIEASGDSLHLFRGLGRLFHGADVVVANLECPLADSGELILKKFMFRGDPAMARRLRAAGFTALSLANNHAYDAGRIGLVETARNLEDAGIAPLGAGCNQDDACRPRFIRTPAGTLALLAFVDLPLEGLTPLNDLPGPALAEKRRIRDAVRAARAGADWVAVTLHWGAEYACAPHPRQEALARLLADEGVDVVLGHHPHVIQPIERIGRTIVAYSLGNLIFDSALPEARVGLVVRVRFSREREPEVEVHPVSIEGCVPRPAGSPDRLPAGSPALRFAPSRDGWWRVEADS